jgi:drug/metabolite transporter (DMT)-like permease
MTVSQPFIAVGIGLAMFGERLHTHGLAPIWEILGILMVVGGVFAISRSSMIAPDQHPV